MAYDQHGPWEADDPGPVGSLDWTAQAVEALTALAPADQVVLGVAGYGYRWGGDEPAGQVSDAAARDLAGAAAATWQDDVGEHPRRSPTAGSSGGPTPARSPCASTWRSGSASPAWPCGRSTCPTPSSSRGLRRDPRGRAAHTTTCGRTGPRARRYRGPHAAQHPGQRRRQQQRQQRHRRPHPDRPRAPPGSNTSSGGTSIRSVHRSRHDGRRPAACAAARAAERGSTTPSSSGASGWRSARSSRPRPTATTRSTTSGIDPRLGDEDDFDALVAAAHDRGLRVLLDGVFNHVGRELPAVQARPTRRQRRRLVPSTGRRRLGDLRGPRCPGHAGPRQPRRRRLRHPGHEPLARPRRRRLAARRRLRRTARVLGRVLPRVRERTSRRLSGGRGHPRRLRRRRRRAGLDSSPSTSSGRRSGAR